MMEQVKLKLQDRLRAQHVKRWSMVDTTRDQSLAEHSFNVAMIAHELGEIVACNRAGLVMNALTHDLAEVVLGDLPTPTKARFDLNADLIDKFVDVGVTEHHLDAVEKKLLKIADLADAALFLHLYGRGNHAALVFGNIQVKIREHIDGLETVVTEDQIASIHKMMDDIFCGEITV